MWGVRRSGVGASGPGWALRALGAASSLGAGTGLGLAGTLRVVGYGLRGGVGTGFVGVGDVSLFGVEGLGVAAVVSVRFAGR
ncbi:hypothetical protein GCM10022295_44430 [Streptomyces osmaniensis]|uniref:Uncharacterized protein n=1 Tax=Streptomyces osmaniensis TaxID=593134 RepID=A0ABP6WYH0_9ACTN